MQVNGAAYPCKWIARVIQRTTDRHGQLLLTPEVTLEGWWTDLDMESEQVIALYRDHATSEQFHSGFKADLDLERLPSDSFCASGLPVVLWGFDLYRDQIHTKRQNTIKMAS
jgi:hypothetical protein